MRDLLYIYIYRFRHEDQNSSYFHACVNQRRRANQISCIVDEGGTDYSTSETIDEAFLAYFRNLFTTSDPGGMDECLEGLPRIVTDAMNYQMLKQPTTDEFNTALAQMAPLKALGPDGFPACFYQDNWSSMGLEVCKASFEFLKSCSPKESMNFTHIAPRRSLSLLR